MREGPFDHRLFQNRGDDLQLAAAVQAVLQGKGQVRTPCSVCYHNLLEILREARQFNPEEFRVIAAPSVVEMRLDEES